MTDTIKNPSFERRYIQQSAAQVFANVYGVKLVRYNDAKTSVIETIDLNKLGFTVTSFSDNGFSMDWINEELDDLDGTVDLGASLSPRTVTLTLVFSSHTRQQDALKTHQLRKLFSRRDLFYLRTTPESGKQLQCRRTGAISIGAPSGGYLREATITLSSPSPYWESIALAFQPLKIGTNLSVDTVALGRAQTDTLEVSESQQKILYNEGDADIDPRSIHTPLKIVVTGGVDAAADFVIQNTTTATEIRLTGLTETEAAQTITFDGVRVYNGTAAALNKSLFAKSNRSVLTIAEGANSIQVTSGAKASTKIQFISRYYFV